MEPLVFRGWWGHYLLMIVGLAIMLGVGIWMFLAGAIPSGVLVTVFSVIGLAITFYAVVQPVLILYPDRLVHVPSRTTVPYRAIRRVVAEFAQADLGWVIKANIQWLRLYLHPDAEHRNGRPESDEADLTLELSLLSAADYKRVQQHLQQRLGG